jgi:RNA polymerase sigma-70 factor, ECF subfamily
VPDDTTYPGSVSEADAATFQGVRPRLFGIAYRVLGGAAEAEDVVQDTWIRWHGANRREVRDASAFLATATMRLAINVTDSARARHEDPGDPWLTEPIDVAADPAVGAERNDAVERAVHTLLEKLSAAERAVYVLREGFDYPYRQIADVLELSEANARQLLVRARARLGSERRRPVRRDEQRRLWAAFRAASQTGDLGQLERLLADEVMANRPLAVAA